MCSIALRRKSSMCRARNTYHIFDKTAKDAKEVQLRLTNVWCYAPSTMAPTLTVTLCLEALFDDGQYVERQNPSRMGH